jgi:hypothetical protein
MADSDAKAMKKAHEAELKATRKKGKEQARELNAKMGALSRLPPAAGAVITVASAMATSYADERVGSADNKHPFTLAAVGGGVIATAGILLADKKWSATAAGVTSSLTSGPAAVLAAGWARNKAQEHAAKGAAPANATAAG